MRQISLLELTDDQYTVEQTSVRNEYEATDADGTTVLYGDHQMFEMEDTFTFTDADGTDVFSVEANGAMDIAGEYSLVDSETGAEVAIFDNDFSLFQDTWQIRDAQHDGVIAEIHSRGALVTLARKLLPIGGLIPRKYTITDDDGDEIGVIDGHVSVRDEYQITLDGDSTLSRELLVAAVMVIDGIQTG